MPCLAQEFHPKLPAATHYCKSLSSLIRETYAHCHVPCVGIAAGAGWSSGEDSDDDSVLDEARDTKQVILDEMRSRQMKKWSRCSVAVDSPTLPLPSSSSTFASWSYSYAPLDPRTVLDELSSPKTCVVVEEEGAVDDGDYCDTDDDESEAFFSVKSCFTRSMVTDPPPSMLRSPEAWERFRDCDGWPFGLCRRPAVLPLPPLPSTPSDSWKWRKRKSVSAVASPRSSTPAYRHKATAASGK